MAQLTPTFTTTSIFTSNLSAASTLTLTPSTFMPSPSTPSLTSMASSVTAQASSSISSHHATKSVKTVEVTLRPQSKASKGNNKMQVVLLVLIIATIII